MLWFVHIDGPTGWKQFYTLCNSCARWEWRCEHAGSYSLARLGGGGQNAEHAENVAFCDRMCTECERRIGAETGEVTVVGLRRSY